jgi:hypothetical protein
MITSVLDLGKEKGVPITVNDPMYRDSFSIHMYLKETVSREFSPLRLFI